MLKNLVEASTYRQNGPRIPLPLIRYIIHDCHFKINEDNLANFADKHTQGLVMKKFHGGYEEQMYCLSIQFIRFADHLRIIYPNYFVLVSLLADVAILYAYLDGKDKYTQGAVPELVGEKSKKLKQFRTLMGSLKIKSSSKGGSYTLYSKALRKKAESLPENGVWNPEIYKVYGLLDKYKMFEDVEMALANCDQNTRILVNNLKEFEIIRNAICFDKQRFESGGFFPRFCTFTDQKYQSLKDMDNLKDFIHKNKRTADTKQMLQIFIADDFNNFAKVFYQHVEEKKAAPTVQQIKDTFMDFLNQNGDVSTFFRDHDKIFPKSIDGTTKICRTFWTNLTALCSSKKVNAKIKASQLAVRPRKSKPIPVPVEMPPPPKTPMKSNKKPRDADVPTPLPRINQPAPVMAKEEDAKEPPLMTQEQEKENMHEIQKIEDHENSKAAVAELLPAPPAPSVVETVQSFGGMAQGFDDTSLTGKESQPILGTIRSANPSQIGEQIPTKAQRDIKADESTNTSIYIAGGVAIAAIAGFMIMK